MFTRAIRVLAGCLLACTSLVASSGDVEAQGTTCPDGMTLASDGITCQSTPDGTGHDDNTATTKSCTQGVLSADGQHCIVPRLDATPAAAAATTAAGTDQAAPIPTFTG